jgi:hypothetical protein
LLDADVRLLHRRVLQVVVNDVDAARARARQHEAGEGRRETRRGRRELPARGVEETLRLDEEDVPGADFDGERAAV